MFHCDDDDFILLIYFIMFIPPCKMYVLVCTAEDVMWYNNSNIVINYFLKVVLAEYHCLNLNVTPMKEHIYKI